MPDAFLRELERVAASFQGVESDPITLPASFQDFAAPLAPQTGTVVLLSGGDLDCARHHLLAAMPWLQLRGRGPRIEAVLGEIGFQFQADPFELFKQVVARLRHPLDIPDLPVTNGLFGYLGYDLKDSLEKLPRTVMDPYGLPDFCLYAPSALLIHQRPASQAGAPAAGGTRLLTPIYSALAQTRPGVAGEGLSQCRQRAPEPPDSYGIGGSFRSGFNAATYRAAVDRIRKYIAAGDVYQVNMSQCFEAPFAGDTYALLRDLYAANPAPFFAYVQAGDHQVVSTSPERYLQLRGKCVETRPIKGTRPRSSDPAEDAALKAELTASPKDDAELSMIVDLLRNDIGRVCEGGSVRVCEHKRLEAYTNVYHLVSLVEGRLEADKDAIDLIKASFPGGSITGCPKIRAMEIIDELEPTRRHIYTGSMGYIGFDDSLDLSIAIRTATISGGRIRFSVGGGVILDSDPQAEFEETLHKGRTLMGALAGTSATMGTQSEPRRGDKVWLNGLLVPEAQGQLPISDLGLQYGFGFFETIRIRKGRPHNLEAHLQRMNQSWQALFQSAPPQLTWEVVIHQLLAANGLDHEEAAVKLMATYGPAGQGGPASGPQRPNLVATARPYLHRLKAIGRPGLHLGTYPEPVASPLLTHKSLNYLFFYLAGQWAARAGFDEALIIDPDGYVGETNTANLLVVDGRRAIQPQSRGCLPGTMQAVVLAQLEKWGYAMEKKPLRPADLTAAPALIATNALMGAVPVMGVDGEAIPPCSELCGRLQAAVGLDEE